MKTKLHTRQAYKMTHLRCVHAVFLLQNFILLNYLTITWSSSHTIVWDCARDILLSVTKTFFFCAFLFQSLRNEWKKNKIFYVFLKHMQQILTFWAIRFSHLSTSREWECFSSYMYACAFQTKTKFTPGTDDDVV